MSGFIFRRVAIILFTFLWLFRVNGQDIIYLTNGEEIESKITEISESEIKYKKFTYLDGPSYILNADKVFMLVFENGTKEIINPINENSAGQSQDNTSQKTEAEYNIGDSIIFFNNDDFLPATIIGFHTEKPLVQIELINNKDRFLVNRAEIFSYCEHCERSIQLSPEYCCNGQRLKVGDRVIVNFKGYLKSATITLLHPQLNFAEIMLTGENKKRTFRFGEIIPISDKYEVATSAQIGDSVIYFDNLFKTGTVTKITDYNITVIRYYRVNGIEYSETKTVSKLRAIKPLP